MNRGSFRFAYLAICAVVLSAASFQVRAQILTADQFSGRATGINSVITTNGTPTTIVAGDTCPLSPRGGSSTVTTSGNLIPGVLGSGTIASSTSASGITSQASSNVNDFFFRGGGWTIQATQINTSTQCNCCDVAAPGCSGNFTITGLNVTDPSGANFPVQLSGTQNQIVTLPNNAGTITLNERSTAPGALTVTGLHINITSGNTNYNVSVATSHSDIICPGVIITAEPVNVSGRIVDQNGAGIYRASVTITNAQGTVVKTAISSTTGDYLFTGIDSGATYVISASSKTYSFTPRSLNVVAEVSGFNLVGTPK
jgi:hypothetical protein